MSEEITEYIVNGTEPEPQVEYKRKINLLAKRLGDIAGDISKLDIKDKRHVIQKLDNHKPNAVIELYNLMLDYMD